MPEHRRSALVRSAVTARAPALHAVDTRTGKSAKPCRSAQSRTYRDSCRRVLSGLESAVGLRLGEQRVGHLEDLVGTAQLVARQSG
jgi:hypothetical protein